MQLEKVVRLTLCLGSTLLLSTTVACGSEGNNDGGSVTAATGAPATPRQEISGLISKMQRDFTKGRDEEFCAQLTEEGRAEVARYATNSAGQETTCEQFVRRSHRLAKGVDIEQKPTKLISLRVTGDTATAMVSNGGRPATPLRFVRQDGEWKIPSPGFSPAPSSPAR